MSQQVFDTSYDRSVFGTKDELSKIVGVKGVALAKIIKEQSVAVVGTVRTGVVGKPPALFRIEDVQKAVEAHQEQQLAKKAAAAAARKLKSGVTPANTDEPISIDQSEVTELTAQAG